MYGKPKNININFLIKKEVIAIILGKFNVTLGFDKLNIDSFDCNINFQTDFSLNGQHYEKYTIISNSYKLHILIGRKIIGAQFIKENKGDLKLIFDSGDELIIHEDDTPYESYTMQTPNGLVVV